MKEFLAEELKYLSPYLLPFPLDVSADNPTLQSFQKRGFVTVIRLPFKDGQSCRSAQEKLEKMDATTMIFLERATMLALDAGGKRRELQRAVSGISQNKNGRLKITIHDDCEPVPRTYWIWNRMIRVQEAPPEFKAALSNLPGKWPNLKEANISIAVRVSDSPEKGVFSIFLPTELPTGCAAHISAPFYGDMSRTNIEFENDYNRLLLKSAAERAVDVIISDLAGKGLDEARAIVDVLTPSAIQSKDKATWFGEIRGIFEAKGIKHNEAEIIFTDKGWCSLEKAKLLPSVDSLKVMVESVFRKNAIFPAVVAGLNSRRSAMEKLFEALQVTKTPGETDIADTIESIAADLHENDGETDWNGFWADVQKLVTSKSIALHGKKILLGKDESLHAGGEGYSVFFAPRQGVDDDDLLSEDAIRDVPRSLSSYVAFLNENIKVVTIQDPRPLRNELRDFLYTTSLVRNFKVEEILRTVLIRRTPPNLPVPLKGSEGHLCRDITIWGLRLVASLRDRGKGGRTLPLLKSLPVPCLGGWYPLQDASFGPGWANTVGQLTHDYLTKAGTADCKESAKLLLQPSSSEYWQGAGDLYQELLSDAGVFNGLRMAVIEPSTWDSKRYTSRDNFSLPELPPSGIAQELWRDYGMYVSRNISLKYSTYYYYEVQKLHTISGLANYEGFDLEVRLLLMHLILGSISRWDDSWSSTLIKKTGGGLSDSDRLESPLMYALRKLPWLGSEADDGYTWSRPLDRWYITAERIAGKPRLFAHLNPIPANIAHKLDNDPKLSSTMQKLGMAKFNTEVKSKSTRLLIDLASSLDKDIADINVYLGQVRAAWSAFYPEADTVFPQKLIVRRGNQRPITLIPSVEGQIYLPDVSETVLGALEMFSLPVVLIETSQAKRLTSQFRAAYGEKIQLASELELVPLVDGKKWEGNDGILLTESELEWIIPLTLCLVAFAGTQPKGTNAKPFYDRVRMFREAKLCWVPNLEVGLYKGAEQTTRFQVPAHWLNKEKILLTSAECQEQPHKLSEAIAALVEREDLEQPLMLALRDVKGTDPEVDEIVHALKRLKIKEEQYREAREQWRGDLGQRVRLIAPMLLILDPSTDVERLQELETEDAVQSFIDKQGYACYDGKKILQLAHKSWNSYELGKEFFRDYGSGAQLDEWNKALIKVNETAVRNEDAEIEFKSHVASALHALRALLSNVIKRNPGVGLFKELIGKMEGLSCPAHYASELWEVGFKEAISAIVPLFELWGATSQELTELKNASDLEQLRVSLNEADVNTDLDPLDVYNVNRKNMEKALQHLQKMGIAWCIDQNIDPVYWEQDTELFLNIMKQNLESSGYTSAWDSNNIFTQLQGLPHDGGQAGFWQQVGSATDLEMLLQFLGLTEKDLNDANERLLNYKEANIRKKRMVPVCGKEFDSSDENLNNLWSHIVSGISDEALNNMSNISLDSPVPLKNVVSKPKHPPKAKKKMPTTRKVRLSKRMEEVIGLAGEIHAYRLLKKIYGDSVVSQTTWVSKNGTIVFPGKEYDDGMGCDFIIPMAGKTYYVEVKASQEDDESFKLGTSEIDLASEVTRKKRRKNEIYQILHITNALSVNPAYHVLPNPYDKRYERLFFKEDAEARIRYKQGSPGKQE